MKTFFAPEQLLHHPQTYLSRGQMRKPQEVPDRALAILRGLGALGLVFFAAFLDLAGPATEEDAVGLERGRVVTEYVAALDVAAERLEDDARHEIANVEFVAGSGADARDGFNLPVHDRYEMSGRAGRAIPFKMVYT